MSADIDCLKNTCECANHDGLLYRRIGERLEKELATAKAENARLASAIKGLQWPTKGWDSKVSLAKAESDAEQALSSSNALDYWKGEIRKAKAEVLNHPEISNFVKGVIIEAQHQRERWGSEHDGGKSPEDWLWLIAYLATKATQANRYGDQEKYLHHIITAAAACANWHANVTGSDSSMRPGLIPKPKDSTDGAA